jgi:hypothetical protein
MRHLSISISWLMAGGPPGTCLRRKRDRQAQTGLGVSSHRPRCLRTCPPLEDLFYDVFGLDESDDGHRPMALGTRQGIDFIDFFYQPSRGG